MCGIAGAFAYGRGELDMDEALLGRMTDALAHRGPDDRGLHLDHERRVALGHRRLSIIDIDAGRQPMSNDDGSLWIVYNGEVYNHAALRQELEAQGVRFGSRCDTEVILRLYEAVGAACVERLDGMFAFAIWDGRRRELFLARDRIGIKPLYFCDVGGRFLFASEPRALLEHPAVSRDVSADAVYHHMSLLSTPSPGTMFEAIEKLPPGHRARVTQGEGIRAERYWSVLDADPIDPRLASDPAAVATEVRDRLRGSIGARMMSDVPFGVFLSGGVDSSANVALMSECSTLPINTFTVAYEGRGVAGVNELEYARRVASDFGTNHREVIIDSASVLDYLPQFVAHQDEPVADPVCVPLYYVSRLARDHGVKVIQVGEGSDELFLGYEPYLQAIRTAERGKWLAGLPKPLRSTAYGLAGPLLRAVGHRALVWEEMLRRVVYEDPFWGGAVLLGDREKRAIAADASRVPSTWAVLERLYGEIDGRWPHAETGSRMTYLELRHRLPELLLARVDKITMSVSLEGRVPFLDHRFVEFVLRLPQALKLEGGRTKAILKRAVDDLLPHELVHRRKQGFPAPISQWLFDPGFGKTVSDALTESPLVRDGWLREDAVQRYLGEHMERRRDRGRVLWMLFNLTLWYRRWVQNEAIA